MDQNRRNGRGCVGEAQRGEMAARERASVCVPVCAAQRRTQREKERERKRARQTNRQTNRQSDSDKQPTFPVPTVTSGDSGKTRGFCPSCPQWCCAASSAELALLCTTAPDLRRGFVPLQAASSTLRLPRLAPAAFPIPTGTERKHGVTRNSNNNNSNNSNNSNTTEETDTTTHAHPNIHKRTFCMSDA